MFELIVILVCLALNSLLSAIEMAIMTAPSAKLRARSNAGDATAKKVLELKSNPERVLSVLQIGITLVGAISAAIGGAGAEENLAPFIQNRFGIGEDAAESIAIVCLVLPLTYFSVVFGELVPKTFALKFPITIAKLGATPLSVLARIFAPVVYILEQSTKFICRLFLPRLKSERVAEQQQASIEIEGLTDIHRQYILNLVSIDKRKVGEVMLAWSDVVTLDRTLDKSVVLDTIKKSGHTRIPILDGARVIGILHSKEFIAENDAGRSNWNSLVRPIQSFLADEPVLNALKTLQSKRSHMALIMRGGEPVGIVTIEDILEEVVGEIYDEDDNPRAIMSLTAQLRSGNLTPN